MTTAVREVTSEEIARHAGLVHAVIGRMRDQLATSLEYEDLYAVGLAAAWQALQRWQPDRGMKKAYVGCYVAQRLLDYQRKATKATGWTRHLGTVADIRSWEENVTGIDGLTLKDTLVSDQDTAAAADASLRLAHAQRRAAELPARERLIATNLLADSPLTLADLGARLGVSESRVCQMMPKVIAKLEQRTPDTGVLLVCRALHPTEQDARREAHRVRPGCRVGDITKKKVRKGRVVNPQGRPAADGSLGRPVWAVEVAA